MLYYVGADISEGRPPRLYRSVEEIRRDIGRIKSELTESDEMINVRNILSELISELENNEADKWQSSVERLIEDAQDAMIMLTKLKDKLDMLNCELEETRCAIRR